MIFLSFDLSPTRVVGDLQKSIPILPNALAGGGGLVFPQLISAQIRTPLMSKYVKVKFI